MQLRHEAKGHMPSIVQFVGRKCSGTNSDAGGGTEAGRDRGRNTDAKATATVIKKNRQRHDYRCRCIWVQAHL